MKNLHLISAMYSSKGHGHEYIRNFCNKLGEDFEITLHIASKKKLGTPSKINTHYTGVEYEKTNAENFTKYLFLASYVRAIIKQVTSYYYYKKILESKLIQKNDLVYIMDYDVLPLLWLMLSFRKKGVNQIFLWIHSAKFKSKDFLYTVYKMTFKMIFNRFIKNYLKGIIVNGKYIKTEIEKNLDIAREKIHVIQYPSEISFNKISKKLSREKLNFSIDDKIILFFGMLRKDKNIELTIQSIAKTKSNAKLIIAGSEASVNKSDLDFWISKHKLKNYFLDINYISEEKMALYYSCSDLLILTYELESGSQSGPLSLARDFELPAIVTDTGEIGKYVLENNVGLLANTKIENQFTERVDCFFDNSKNQKDSLNENLKIAKKKYSWDSARVKYLILFNGKYEN